MTIPMSVLDLAPIARGADATESIAASVALAQRAEECGYSRVWYAEHHNMPRHRLLGHQRADRARRRADVAHPARRRRRHAAQPLPAGHRRAVRHPGGDVPGPHRPRSGAGAGLGPEHDVRVAPRPHLGRPVPGGRAGAAGLPRGQSRVPGVDAVPGKGSKVPLYILGSSLFGAHLAAALGLPYAFASHFAPQMLEAAVATYRREFTPSAQLDAPVRHRRHQRRRRRHGGRGPGAALTSRRLRATGSSGSGGTSTPTRRPTCCWSTARPCTSTRCSPTPRSGRRPRSARPYSGSWSSADADELIVAHQSPTPAARLRSVELLAEAMTPARR